MTHEPGARTDFGSGAPSRIRILPDDHHVPVAGTLPDGRRCFVSEELFAGDQQFVAAFIWSEDGTFEELRVIGTARAASLPPGQAGPRADGAAGLEDLVAELGGVELGPIDVQPFAVQADGVEFGFVPRSWDGEWGVSVEPGDFIAYSEPWDGEDYDT
jgi:hypothetical protein